MYDTLRLKPWASPTPIPFQDWALPTVETASFGISLPPPDNLRREGSTLNISLSAHHRERCYQIMAETTSHRSGP